MKVLVATKEYSVFDILGSADDVEHSAALDTGHVYEALPETQLAIVDYSDLIPHPFSVEFVRRLIAASPLQQCSSAEFLATPDDYLEMRKPAGWPYKMPAKRTIVFTSYSGGTGKTSLSLDTALQFVEQSRLLLQLPAAVLELTYGSSALRALVGGGQSGLDELVVQPELEPYHFQGVSLYPMDYDRVRSLSIDQVGRYLHRQMSHHVLTVVDTIWPHGLASAIGEAVDLWIVLTTPRIDAVENARRLRRELALQHGEDKVILAVNKMGGLGATLSLIGTRRDLEIPHTNLAEIFFEGRLGRDVLSYLYAPLWQAYVRAGNRRRRGRRWRLFRRRSQRASQG